MAPLASGQHPQPFVGVLLGDPQSLHQNSLGAFDDDAIIQPLLEAG